MAWRNPQFAYLHAARDVGVASITPDGAFTGSSKAYLIDDRPSVQFTWDGPAAANHTIDIDLGANWVTGLDRLYIPNHDITSNWTLTEDTTSDFATDPQVRGAGVCSAGVDFDGPIGTPTEDRYLRIKFISSGAWSMGQLWISTTVTTTAGPEQGWTDELIPNVIQFPSGDAIQTDSDQQLFEFRYPVAGAAAAADKTNLEALIAAVSTYRPFLLDPPYDTESVKLVKMNERARVRINTLVPASGTPTADIRLSMLEYLG
jgi:hypothetical protein